MTFKIWIKASPEKVYSAVSDLTRHAKWAAHPITISPVGSGPVKVESQYKSQHAKAKSPDIVTITELAPNQRFGFKAVMPNKLAWQHTMSLSSQGDGTTLAHDTKLVGGPAMVTVMLHLMMPILVPLAASGPEKKFLNKLKAELDQAS